MSAADYNFDLGTWSRPITTASHEAQLWFDRGLNWAYAYNHEEAVACFRRALSADPDCAMAWWGVAYAGGPFYNRPWIRYSTAELAETVPLCFAAASNAVRLGSGSTPAERALIEALALRYQTSAARDTDTLMDWHGAYTVAMREVHRAHPEDPDIAALFAEAAVTCTPRQLWDLHTGAPKPGALTEEAVAVLEAAMATPSGTDHPGILHMWIHTLEMSPFPVRAMAAADKLCAKMPDAGHLEHMPAHIYVLCGDYQRSVTQSERAVEADDKYLAFAGSDNFYTTARCHDLHLYIYAAMFLGQRGQALHAADRIRDFATPDLVAESPPFMASILEGYSGMRTHVLVRFGMWDDLIAERAPEPSGLYPVRTAMHHYGRGVAFAALGRLDEAEQAQSAFRVARLDLPETAIFLSNTARDVLAVGDAMLAGEIAYRRGDDDAGFAALREAVRRDDNLNYTEPWAWMHPPRHALGALLAEQGHHDEAITAFRQDLGLDGGLPRCCQHPGNVWALTGLVAAMRASGRTEGLGALEAQLTSARALTDTPIGTACFCARSEGA